MWWPAWLPFGWTCVVLLFLQAGLVALPASGLPRFAEKFAGRAWLIVLPASIGGVMALLAILPSAAEALTWGALIVFPILAAISLGWAIHGAQTWFALASLPAIFVATAFQDSLWGNLCAALLTALSCVTLARLLVGVVDHAYSGIIQNSRVNGMWLVRAVIVITAILDAYLVFSGELETPNNTLNNATPAIPLPPHPHPGPNGTDPGNDPPREIELPRLQFLKLGAAFIGYEDVFIASVLGVVLATEGVSLKTQTLAAGVALILSLLFSLLFAVVETLPCTVPIAATALIFCCAKKPQTERDSDISMRLNLFSLPRATA